MNPVVSLSKTASFDIIVVGAGHAGIEASLIAARLGQKTLLVTTNIDRIGYMSCNPSIGGLAKGHMVREIDVLGGQMGHVADRTCLQFKRLNASRGPAVRGTRTQNDKALYSQIQKETVLAQPNLSTIEGEVKSLILENRKCVGVILADGSQIKARRTIITTGTFMNGVMHVGLEQSSGGRIGDKASIGLSDQLKEFGFTVRRLKTGTPARLHKDSIDWSKTTPQAGDEKFFPFSFKSDRKFQLPQVLCYLSNTTEKTHDIIRNNLDKSPMFTGVIEGTGPRYCPSIEDKITRFSDRTSHQTFLEPESLSTDLIYLQGISTSLPKDVQDEFLRTIAGLENVKVVRYGYAVEYDFIEPTQIHHRLETRQIENLFLAGQINGTSGYEEAAAQGFVAGVNAVHSLLEKEEFILARSESYTGVLIDDLVTKGTREPYRMFTSRAEHRLVLREDNTIDRLAETSRRIGVLSHKEIDQLLEIKEKRKLFQAELNSKILYPSSATNLLVEKLGTQRLNKPTSAADFLRRSEIQMSDLATFDIPIDPDEMVADAVEIEVKYAGYIKKQEEIIRQTASFENQVIPEGMDYSVLRGLSVEERDKLKTVKPRTLGQAQRISGVNPSAIQSLMIYLRSHGRSPGTTVAH
jgi:tRNA uridine 5-carboxymethylaminomethyl modification enzyme